CHQGQAATAAVPRCWPTCRWLLAQRRVRAVPTPSSSPAGLVLDRSPDAVHAGWCLPILPTRRWAVPSQQMAVSLVRGSSRFARERISFPTKKPLEVSQRRPTCSIPKRKRTVTHRVVLHGAGKVLNMMSLKDDQVARCSWTYKRSAVQQGCWARLASISTSAEGDHREFEMLP